MRIAWVGPPPSDDSGVPTVGRLLIEGMADAGAQIDVFAATGQTEVSQRLEGRPGVTVLRRQQRWEWDRWYSRTDVSVASHLSERMTRAAAQWRLVRDLLAQHRAQAYDAVYQFSQPELLSLRAHLAELPPLIVHPQVHAAGELRGHRRELVLARNVEPRYRLLAVSTVLSARARIQARDLRLAAAVVAPSSSFASLLVNDCRVRPERLHVVGNPVDLERFCPRPVSQTDRHPLEVLFVSRLSTRKGVELVVELSHRLSDQRGDVVMRVVGSPSLWSDYRGLLRGLNHEIASYEGSLDGEALVERYRAADVCVVPSWYEPFGLVAAEALACGTAVVASDAVGALEQIEGQHCLRFPTGDADAFESAVRVMLKRVSRNGSSVRIGARWDAERNFGASDAGVRLAKIVLDVSAR